MLPVDRLVPCIRNARTQSEDQIARIAASIAEFGFTNPILIGADEVIIAGHGRLMAARAPGLTEVPVVVPDHLTEARRRALVIADNPQGGRRPAAVGTGGQECMVRTNRRGQRRPDLSVPGWRERNSYRTSMRNSCFGQA